MIDKSTIVDILSSHADEDNVGIGHYYYNKKSAGFVFESYAELARISFDYGYKLISKGITKGTLAIIIGNNPESQLLMFYGAICAGANPLLMPAINSRSTLLDICERINNISDNISLEVVVIIDVEIEQIVLRELNSDESTYYSTLVFNKNSLNKRNDAPKINLKKDDVAYYQLTSASTGNARMVCITHENVLSNIYAIYKASNCNKNETGISWLPLNHDMGLVGAELFCIGMGFSLYLMSPSDFMRRPGRWIKFISEYKCTMAVAPNFAYEYVIKYISEKELNGLDLTRWRLGFVGAEPISVDTMSRFLSLFKQYGLSTTTLMPVYGLAESTLATTFSDPEEELSYVTLDNFGVEEDGKLKLLSYVNIQFYQHTPTLKNAITLFNVGKPVDGMEVCLLDSNDNTISDELVAGEIVISGTSVAKGYIGQGCSEIKPFNNRFRTGDIGFRYKGNYYVLDRAKNVIIKNGKNYYSGAIETSLASVLGLNRHQIAVFESIITGDEKEIIAFIEDCAHEIELKDSQYCTDTPIDKILIYSGRQIPRTSSGKKQYHKCRALYLNNKLNVDKVINLSVMGSNNE